MTPTSAHLIRALGAAVLIAIVLPASASAQQTRTYVDRATGSDANDCVYDTPCLSFQRAHDMTVPNGEINVKSPGNYSSVIITKPITIDGNGNVATITPFGMGVTVNLPSGSGRVVLRDIRINAAANIGAGGIDVLRGATVTTDNVRIYGGSVAGIRVQNSQDPATRLIVDDSKIQGSTGKGMFLTATAGHTVRATIRNTTIDDNAQAAVLLQPTGGTVRASVRDAHVDANANGLVADSVNTGTAVMNVISSAITDSGIDPAGTGIGVWSNGPKSTARIARNEIMHNERGLRAQNGGKIASAGDNDIVGNVIDGAATLTWPKG